MAPAAGPGASARRPCRLSGWTRSPPGTRLLKPSHAAWNASPRDEADKSNPAIAKTLAALADSPMTGYHMKQANSASGALASTASAYCECHPMSSGQCFRFRVVADLGLAKAQAFRETHVVCATRRRHRHLHPSESHYDPPVTQARLQLILREVRCSCAQHQEQQSLCRATKFQHRLLLAWIGAPLDCQKHL